MLPNRADQGGALTLHGVSWDLFVMDLPAVERMEDIPADFKGRSLGGRDALIARIRNVLPTADFTDPAWGTLVTPDYVIEFNIGRDPVDSFALHVRGGGDVVRVISRLLDELELQACDPQSDSGIFKAAAGRASFERWQAFRDRALEKEG
jgi:hypothetical protein